MSALPPAGDGGRPETPSNRPAPWVFVVAAAAAVVVIGAIVVVLAGGGSDDQAGPTTTTVVATTAVSTTLAPTTTTTTAATTTTVATTVPASTTTTRTPNETLSLDGVGPLRPGMTTRQALDTKAVVLTPGPDPNLAGACETGAAAGSYLREDFAVLFLNGNLSRIYVAAGSRLRTPQGIGVGTDFSELDKVPGTRTQARHPYGRGTEVTVLTGTVGYKFTVFEGKVEDWSVGTKEALELPEGCS